MKIDQSSTATRSTKMSISRSQGVINYADYLFFPATVASPGRGSLALTRRGRFRNVPELARRKPTGPGTPIPLLPEGDMWALSPPIQVALADTETTDTKQNGENHCEARSPKTAPLGDPSHGTAEPARLRAGLGRGERVGRPTREREASVHGSLSPASFHPQFVQGRRRTQKRSGPALAERS